MEKKKFNVLAAVMILLLAIFAVGMVKNADTLRLAETVNTAAEK